MLPAALLGPRVRKARVHPLSAAGGEGQKPRRSRRVRDFTAPTVALAPHIRIGEAPLRR